MGNNYDDKSGKKDEFRKPNGGNKPPEKNPRHEKMQDKIQDKMHDKMKEKGHYGPNDPKNPQQQYPKK